MGLGPYHTVSLQQARERARKARERLLDGEDPIDARRKERARQALESATSLTFEQATISYFDSHEGKWKNLKHRAQFLSTMRTYVFPKLGKLTVSDIETGLIVQVLEAIWASKTETASRVRGRIESVLDWATVRGLRKGDNPARWRGHLEHILPDRGSIAKTKHHPALAYTAIPEFLTNLRKREGVAARALEFLILTAARTGEVIGATWDEIDLVQKTWTIPASRMKAGREHKVPLSNRALQILKVTPAEGSNKFLFIGSRARGLSNMAMAAAVRRMDYKDITVHGFRSTFRDWAAESTSYPNHVVEMALAHTISNKVEAAYLRSDLFDKRRKLMEDWGLFCESKQRPVDGSVVPIRAR